MAVPERSKKRPRDVNRLARQIVDEATDDAKRSGESPVHKVRPSYIDGGDPRQGADDNGHIDPPRRVPLPRHPAPVYPGPPAHSSYSEPTRIAAEPSGKPQRTAALTFGTASVPWPDARCGPVSNPN